MNIIFASDMYYPTLGGITVATDQLVRELAKNGHHVTLIAPSPSIKTYKETINSRLSIFRIGSITIIRKKGVRFAFNSLAVRKFISANKPDIIHIITPGLISETAFSISKKLGLPTVATNHIVAANLSSGFKWMPKSMIYLVEKYGTQHIKNFYQKVDHIISPSIVGEEYMRNIGITKPISVLSNGIHVEKFANLSETDLYKLRKKLEISDKKIILYVGRFDKEKQVNILIDAFSKLYEELDVQLVLAGSGVDKDIIKSSVDKKRMTKVVTFVGVLSEEELIALYHLASVFVMPSPVELQSLATMEAMSASKPVVGADAMALPYLIHPGSNGNLFEPGNANDLAEKIKSILVDDELRKSMGVRSFEYIKEHDMSNVVKKFEKLYQSLI